MSGCYALVPAKDPVRGKSRLAALFNERERRALNVFMARRTLDVCRRYFGRERTALVTESRAMAEIGKRYGVNVVFERREREGLNQALGCAAMHARLAGAATVVVVPADLVLLSVPVLAAAMRLLPESPGCLLVPDRREEGTNVLALTSPPENFYSFGTASFRRHERRARELGYRVHIHRCRALGLDLDLPEDYRQWLGGQGKARAQLGGALWRAG